MPNTEKKFQEIANKFSRKNNKIQLSPMFGMRCLKIKNKAFTGFFKSNMAFKLSDDAHKKVLVYKGSKLVDPSGMGRAIKEREKVPGLHAKDCANLPNML